MKFKTPGICGALFVVAALILTLTAIAVGMIVAVPSSLPGESWMVIAVSGLVGSLTLFAMSSAVEYLARIAFEAEQTNFILRKLAK